MKNKWMKFVVIGLTIIFLFEITGCSEVYDESEKYIVNVTVLRTEKESHWNGKYTVYDYNVYFDTGNSNEWIVDNSELFNCLKAGDVISVFRTDYIKDGKIIKMEYDFIN